MRVMYIDDMPALPCGVAARPPSLREDILASLVRRPQSDSSVPFHGDTTAERILAGVRLMENTYPSDLRLAKHSHPDACFSLLLSGAYAESYGPRDLDWQPRTVGFNPPEEQHSSRFSRLGARFFIVELNEAWLARARSQSIRLEGSATLTSGPLLWLANRLYHEFRFPDEASGLAVEAIVLEMMAEFARSGRVRKKTPPWMRQVEELMRSRYAEPLTLGEIAGAVDIHPVHLARAFRRHHRSTVGDYLRRLRVEAAASKLAGSSEPLSAIGTAAGFADQSHFSRVFKRLTGLTPAAYRQAHRLRS